MTSLVGVVTRRVQGTRLAVAYPYFCECSMNNTHSDVYHVKYSDIAVFVSGGMCVK